MDPMDAPAPEELPVFDVTERRVLGTLVEKALATPDAYPLTLNALVSGCNQKSNRDPVMALEPFEIEGALTALKIKGFAKSVERLGGRTVRFGHRLGERFGLNGAELAVLAELMLRGPQTVNELKTRIARMGASLSGEEVEALLRRRAEGDPALVRSNPRGPGERFPRWQHLLAPATEAPPPPPPEAAPAAAGAGPTAPNPRSDLLARIEALEVRVARLESRQGLASEAEAASGEDEEGASDWIEMD